MGEFMTHALHREVSAILQQVSEQIILPRFRNLAAADIAEKTPGDLVTIADKESEAALSEALSRLLPNSAIVGEEAVAADADELRHLSAPACWIIDPIDGTHNFAHGKAPFGIIIALCHDGVTEEGWLYDPLTGRMSHAVRGGGAFVNGQRIRAAATSAMPPIAAISELFLNAGQHDALRADIAPHYTLVDIPRCAAEQYPRLVLAQNDVSLFERVLPWDHAAGILFLNEAGGMAARPDGRAYAPTQDERGLIGAASPALFEAIVERLKDADWFAR